MCKEILVQNPQTHFSCQTNAFRCYFEELHANGTWENGIGDQKHLQLAFIKHKLKLHAVIYQWFVAFLRDEKKINIH